METGETPHEVPSAAVEPWEHEITREEIYNKDDGLPSAVPSITRELLVSYPQIDQEAARKAAQQIDHDYWDVYQPSDPLMKFTPDKEMADFLARLHHLLFNLAQCLPYDDSRQEALVQLLVELRKLPAKLFTIRNADTLIYVDDPIFSSMSYDAWNGFGTDDWTVSEKSDDENYLHKVCAKWTNISVFFARCLVAGLFDNGGDTFKYPDVDIKIALEEDLPAGELGDCRLMVALQWILHAGSQIHDNMAKLNLNQWDVTRWKVWQAKIKDIEGKGHPDERIQAAVQQALKKMTEIMSDEE